MPTKASRAGRSPHGAAKVPAEQPPENHVGTFSALVRRYQDLAFASAYSRLGDRHLAEDVAQEAFLTAWCHIDQLRDHAAFPSWLRSIVHRQCTRARRGKARRLLTLALTAESPEQADAQPDPEQALVLRERERALIEPVNALPARLREVVTLFYIADCSLQEIAELLHLREGTVKKRLHDARVQLRARLAQEGFEMTEKRMQDERPSRDERFAAQVIDALNAASRGDVPRMSALLEADAALANAPGPHPVWGGQPQPLHVAAERGHLAIVRELLDQGADVNGRAATYDGWSPLMLAAHGGRLGMHPRRQSIVRLLIERGAAVDIFVASLLGDETTVAALLEGDPSLARATGPAAATALHFAHTPGIAARLLASGASPQALCGWGTTALERASFRSSSGRAVADALIAAGATVHACALACLGDSARLRSAVEAEPGAIHTRAKVGPSVLGTPLHGAAQFGHVEVARFLLDRGADPNSRADHGQTPLHLSSRSLELTRLLIARGADREARDSDHNTTPLTWARFMHENLEPDHAELPRVIEYLAQLKA